MTATSWVLVGLSGAILAYTFVGYPLALKLLRSLGVRRDDKSQPPPTWPPITITVPAYNEESQIAETVESLLRIDYPGERQILIVSDASSDRTDEIVGRYLDRGVELVRMPDRIGKTALENQVAHLARGEIVVNTDASIRLDPQAVTRLVERFTDPTIGVATGRDVSASASGGDSNVGEAGYVGMEMRLRNLESDVAGLIGASGSLYAIRRELHDYRLAGGLSRDFAAALVSRLGGFVTVSVPNSLCVVPLAKSIQGEYRRKVRTVTRGMSTLWHFRTLLNPLRHGLFAWMLWSHKVARWMIPIWSLVIGIGLAFSASSSVLALGLLLGGLGSLTVAIAAWIWTARGGGGPRLLSLAAYALASNVAVLHAWTRAILGTRQAIWEPTRR